MMMEYMYMASNPKVAGSSPALDTATCVLRQGTLSILSQSNKLKWVTAYADG